MKLRLAGAAAAVALVLFGCPDGRVVHTVDECDSGIGLDCGDRGLPVVDAGSDAGALVDAGGPPTDAGVDAGVDAGIDAGVDAGTLLGLDTLLRYEIPCIADLSDGISCTALDPFVKSARMVGTPGTTYQVTVRVRGVSELKGYSYGTVSGYWSVGGAPSVNAYNTVRLEVSNPQQVYFLNNGSNGLTRCFALDYTQTLPIAAGATVNLMAETNDAAILKNLDGAGTPLVAPGVPPAPSTFNGQFMQIDVVDVR
jgi:hypothetical protein